MKVRVSIPGAYMAMELGDEMALASFRKMTELLLGYGAQETGKSAETPEGIVLTPYGDEEKQALKGIAMNLLRKEIPPKQNLSG